jgi:hypothetical protein
MDLFQVISLIGEKNIVGLFGPDAAEVHKKYRGLCRLIHPDANKKDKAVAEKAFKDLQELYEVAKGYLGRGTYGAAMKEKAVVITTKTNKYALGKKLYTADLTDIFIATNNANEKVILKICRSAVNNDLVQNEATVLKAMWDGPTKDLRAMAHIPKLLDSFTMSRKEGDVQVNVLPFYEGFVTLEEVIKAYPTGVGVKSMAWMFNRILAAILMADQSGYVHGAVIPPHFLINPETHNGILIDWSYAVPRGSAIKAIVPAYKVDYAPEVFVKQSCSGTDIYMAASLATHLLGGKQWYVEDSVPLDIVNLIRAAMLSSTVYRTKNAFELHTDFGKILQKHYGPPSFTEFKMPVK